MSPRPGSPRGFGQVTPSPTGPGRDSYLTSTRSCPGPRACGPTRRNVAGSSQAHLGPGYLMGQRHARVKKWGRPSGENSGVGAEALISLQSGGAPGEEPFEQGWGWVAELATGGPMMSRGVQREVQGVPGWPGGWRSKVSDSQGRGRAAGGAGSWGEPLWTLSGNGDPERKAAEPGSDSGFGEGALAAAGRTLPPPAAPRGV